jgi:hypothetical protein
MCPPAGPVAPSSDFLEVADGEQILPLTSPPPVVSYAIGAREGTSEKHSAPSINSAKIAVPNEIGWSVSSDLGRDVKIQKPVAPSSPWLEVVDGKQIRISWSPPTLTPPVLSYAIAVREGATVKYFDPALRTLVADKGSAGPVPSDTTSVVLGGAVASMQYQAKIAVQNAIGWSVYSDWGHQVEAQAPLAPSTPSLEVLDGEQIRISWSPATLTPPVLSYAIVVREGATVKYFDPALRTLVADKGSAGPVPADTTSVVLGGAIAGIGYRAKIAVQNAIGWSVYSDWGHQVKIQKPVAPSTPSLEVLDGQQIRISWPPAILTPPVLNYAIVVREGTTEKYFDPTLRTLVADKGSAGPVPVDTTSVVLCGAVAGIQYRAKIAVQNAIGWSCYSDLSSSCVTGHLTMNDGLSCKRNVRARTDGLGCKRHVRVLYHATRESNARAICSQRRFLPGSFGLLGPGIYFSASPSNAKRWAQCRSGSGPVVILRCEVNLGSLKTVNRGHYSHLEWLKDGSDSYREEADDVYMIPNNDKSQIDMDSIRIEAAPW